MEIPVLNILRPHQNGPYRLLSILKDGYNVMVTSKQVFGVFLSCT